MLYAASPDASAALAALVIRIRQNLLAIDDAQGDLVKVHATMVRNAIAAGKELNRARDGLVLNRQWCRFLKRELGLGRTKAFNYGLLAKHEKKIEPFVLRAEQTGKPFSITAAMKLIGHGRANPGSQPARSSRERELEKKLTAALQRIRDLEATVTAAASAEPKVAPVVAPTIPTTKEIDVDRALTVAKSILGVARRQVSAANTENIAGLTSDLIEVLKAPLQPVKPIALDRTAFRKAMAA
jgi:hypothetical protein